jgi:hypothetical protein
VAANGALFLGQGRGLLPQSGYPRLIGLEDDVQIESQLRKTMPMPIGHIYQLSLQVDSAASW